MAVSVSDTAPRLGIIAGGGSVPRNLIEACQKLGRAFFVMCLEGQADADLARDLPHVWLPLGAASKLKQIVAEQKITEIVMIGRVRRPSLPEIRPDWLALKVLTRIGMNMLGDDALLRAIGAAVEEEAGVRVIAVQDVLMDYLTPVGQLGTIPADGEALKDIERGLTVARELGRLDIGQSVIVQQGIVLGVEAIEGTDALITRCGTMQREGTKGVLVKIAKPQQDNRYDLPTVGPDTITSMIGAGLRGIVLEAGRSLLVDRDRTVDLANAAGLFIIGRSLESDHDA